MHEGDLPLYGELARWGRMFGVPVEPPGTVARTLAHGDRVACGSGSLEVLHTPGHTPGSICSPARGRKRGPLLGGHALPALCRPDGLSGRLVGRPRRVDRDPHPDASRQHPRASRARGGNDDRRGVAAESVRRGPVAAPGLNGVRVRAATPPRTPRFSFTRTARPRSDPAARLERRVEAEDRRR